MYENERIRFDWKGFLLKLLFLIIVLILIIKLLPLKKKNTKEEKSEVFIKNIETIQNTSNTYYSFDNLPEEIGESHKASLKDLISVGAVKSLKAKDGNLCDEDNSFVKVTKEKDKYKFEFHLICSDEVDTSYLNKTYDKKIDTTKQTTKTTFTTTTKKPIRTTNQNYTPTTTQYTTITRKVVKSTTTSNKVIIIYNSNGGTNVDSQFVLRGTIPTKPNNPTKYGYTFMGWMYNNSFYNFDTPLNQNIVLRAKWKIN